MNLPLTKGVSCYILCARSKSVKKVEADLLIKNFSDWLRALPVAQRIIAVTVLTLVLWFVVLPLVGELLVFLRDAFIVYVLPLACAGGVMLAIFSAFSPVAGKAIAKLLSVGFGALVNAAVQIILAACGHKEKKDSKKDGDKSKDKKDDDDES